VSQHRRTRLAQHNGLAGWHHRQRCRALHGHAGHGPELTIEGGECAPNPRPRGRWPLSRVQSRPDKRGFRTGHRCHTHALCRNPCGVSSIGALRRRPGVTNASWAEVGCLARGLSGRLGSASGARFLGWAAE